MEEITLWWVNCANLPRTQDFYLTASEQARCRELRREEDRIRYQLIHSALHEILAKELNCAPSELDFVYGPNQKPLLRDAQLKFNLTHTVDAALIALSPTFEVGVDLEKNLPLEALALAKRFFAPCEADLIARLPPEEQGSSCLKLWCGKEALTKMIGGKLYDYLEYDLHSWLECEAISVEIQGICGNLHKLDLPNGYIGALAVAAPENVRYQLKWCSYGKNSST